RLDHAWPGAPAKMEAGHGIAVAMRHAAAALGPADDRKPAHAHGMEPRTHLAGGKIDKGLGHLARPEILRPVEASRSHPVLQGEFAAVADAHAPLLGAVDEEQAAERPESLPAEGVF